MRDAVGPRLEDAEFHPATMRPSSLSNQAKWLISAYAIFFGGGVLVPRLENDRG
jgi:hypothetical protein